MSIVHCQLSIKFQFISLIINSNSYLIVYHKSPVSTRGDVSFPYFRLSSQNATALAAATFKESTPFAMGISTV